MDKQAKSKLIVLLSALLVIGAIAYFVSAAPNFQGIAVINNTDMFYSPYETINFSITTIGNIPDNATSVQVNFTSINASACGGTGYLNLTNTSALNSPTVNWIGGCAVSTFFNYSITNPTLINGNSIDFIAYNASGGANHTIALSPILLHNMDVPTMPPGGCQRFGNQTTNMSLVNDFAHVNFIIQIEMNGSCLAGPGGGSSPWAGFEQIMMLNFTSLNMSSQTIGQRLAGLQTALQVNITAPHQFGTTRIYVNESAFSELNTNTTITLNNLPFASLASANIVPDNSSRPASSVVFTPRAPFNLTVQQPSPFNVSIPRGDLQFTVVGFSGYNASDTAKPLITFNGLLNTSGSNLLVNVSVNGTGTTPSLILISNISGGANYTYNASDGTNTAQCAELNVGSDTYQCSFLMNVTGADGTRTITVNAWDYGDGSPGNTNSSSANLILDTIKPAVTIVTPVNYQNQTSRAIKINVTAVDATFSNLTIIVYNSTGSSVNSTVNTTSSSVNTTLSVPYDGIFTVNLSAYDAAGNTNSTTKVVNVDQTGPTITVVSPVNGSTYYTNQSILVQFNAADAVVGVGSKWTNTNVTTNVSYSGAFNINFTTNGTYTVLFYANDTLNNLATLTLATINVINLPGNVTLITNQTNIIVNQTTTNLVVAANTTSAPTIVINTTMPSNQTYTIDLSQITTAGNATVPSNITMIRSSDSVNYTVTIPANTNISGGAGWDGKITMPIVNSSTFTAPSSGTANLIIDLGSTVQLNFSNPVKIVLGGMSGKKAAWSRGTTTLTDITTVCDSATAPTNVPAAGECYKDSGSDLVIWTYHFTSFAAYTAATTTSSSSSSSSGGATITPTASWKNTYVEDDKEFSEKQTITKSMEDNEAVRIMIDRVLHYVGIVGLTSTTAIIQVESTPQQATLNIGDGKEFDVTNDGYYDVKVTLNSISSGKAGLTLSYVHDKVSTTAPVVPTTEAKPSIPEAIKTITTSKNGIIWISAIVLIVAIIVVVVLVKRRQQPYY